VAAVRQVEASPLVANLASENFWPCSDPMEHGAAWFVTFDRIYFFMPVAEGPEERL
jgi:hypothetical protein